MTRHKQTVFVGLSGGVDSSVSAYRLLKQGYNVVGVFIKVWQPEFLSCNWEQERLDAMRVCAYLGIPFLTCDAEAEYKKSVGEYFISEYSKGRTPNPDVMCNKAVKFGAFLSFAKKHGADFIATGHYAQNIFKNGDYTLQRGADTEKDQTYFLWTLTQEQLRFVLFPVGDSTKESIRKEASRANLPTAIKKESQGICFLGHVNIETFMQNFTPLKSGAVLNKAGEQIGIHNGALIYTIGQRHGYTITDTSMNTKPHFVIAKDIEKNQIVVATEVPKVLSNEKIAVSSLNWISKPPRLVQEFDVQFRYRQKPFKATLSQTDDTSGVLEIHETAEKPAVGQSCVFYKDSICFGGGIIE